MERPSVAATRYAKTVKRLPQVVAVAAETRRGAFPRIWTVISAPPFESEHRRPIYEIERGVLEATGLDLEFRLVNINELNEPIEQVIPQSAQMLYRRS